MWTIVGTAPISVVLVLIMAFLAIGIVRAMSISIVENEQRVTTAIFLSIKKTLKNPICIPLFCIQFLMYLFVYFLYPILRFVPDNIYPKFLYPIFLYHIEKEITSTRTRVIFTRRKHNNNMICLKLYKEKGCNDKLVKGRVEYLLEGLKFNRRLAPRVYLGIAPVESSENPDKILRRKLIMWPDENKLKPGVQYALVMRRLQDDWRLDKQLSQGKLDNAEGMEFLAKEVARMHKKLDNSPEDKSTSTSISSKLEINRQLFEECLSPLTQDWNFIKKYRWISDLMAQAYTSYTDLFQRRYDGHYIKRCHGDLKATNLWVRPKSSLGRLKNGRELIALDCVDFNPDFCHIDILSDVAMLAIDLEMHLTNLSDQNMNTYNGQKLAKHFLHCYLREVQETSELVHPLLEYYMTEKSMVCAYVSTLYNNQPEQGKKYLDVALIHAQRLQAVLESTEYSFASQQTAITVG